MGLAYGRSAAALALTAALTTAATAQAATVSGSNGSFVFEAAPGETNRVEARADGGVLTFRDRGGGVTAGPGCESFSNQSVICSRGGSPVLRVDFNLRDGHDLLDASQLLYSGSHTQATIDAGDGDDQVSHGGGDDQFSQGGSTENPEGNGVITLGGDGNDRLLGSGVLDGGPGADEIRGQSSQDRLEGGEGNDTLDGGAGADVVNGGPGADVMHEGSAIHTTSPALRVVADGWLDGGDGDDDMFVGGSDSTVVGGPGNDTIHSEGQWADGGDGNDTMRGTRELRGGPGDDTLRAGAHDTVVDGGSGDDTLVPGDGQDTLSFRSREQGVRIDLGNPDAFSAVTGERDRIAPGFERVEGTNSDDEIIGGSTPISVDGLAGDDQIVGSPGPDMLDGGPHHDLIAGGGGGDTLIGGADTIDAGYKQPDIRAVGNDTIDGGPGDDAIVPRGGDDYVTAGLGNDRVDLRENARMPTWPGSTPLNHSHVIQMSGADQVWCGGGADHADGDYADSIALECKSVTEGTPPWRSVKVRSGRPLRLTVRCAWAEARPCKGVASLVTVTGEPAGAGAGAPPECRQDGGQELANARFRIRAGRVNYIRLRLDRASERRVMKRKCVAVAAVLNFDDAFGRRWETTRSLSLRRSGG